VRTLSRSGTRASTQSLSRCAPDIGRDRSRKLPRMGTAELEVGDRCVEIWLAGEWKRLGASESKEISRREDEGETNFEVTSRGHKYAIDLGQMTQTNLVTGRVRTMRLVDTHAPNSSAAAGFDSFRQAFRDRVSSGPMTERAIAEAWLCNESHADVAFVRATVRVMMQDMSIRGKKDIDLMEWNHYWALDRDSPSYQASKDLNEQLAESWKNDPSILGRMQMHFEAALSEEKTSSGLTHQGLIRLCERLVAWPTDVIEKRWAAEVLSKHEQGECTFEEDTELNYFDFLNVMLGRKRFKVSLWMYDISDGLAKRLSWLLLGRQLKGIWHTGVVVEFDERHSEFWFGGKLFDSVPGSTPFGKPVEKRNLGYTYKTRDEIRNFLARRLAHDFTKEKYDVLTHNCNHFSDRLCMFLHNEHVPDDIVNQPDMVMSTAIAKALRPLLNRWLGGFGGEDSSSGTQGQADTHTKMWGDVKVGAIVEFSTVEGGRPLVGETLEVSAECCTVRCLDFWQRDENTWCVPSSLVLRILQPASQGFDMAPLTQEVSSEDEAAAAVCKWSPLPSLLCSSKRPPTRPSPQKKGAFRV